MVTPIPFIMLALKGKVEFQKLITPSGAAPGQAKAEPDPPQEVVDQKLRTLMAAFRRG